MAKIVLDLDITQIEKLIEKLPPKEKIRLVRKLEQETWGKRMEQLLKRIDKRSKKYPISEKEIKKEIEAVRKEIFRSKS